LSLWTKNASAAGPGADVMILKLFLQILLAKKLALLTQSKGKILIITSVFEKNAYLFAENCRKSQKS
jgi:hypothetical protein